MFPVNSAGSKPPPPQAMPPSGGQLAVKTSNNASLRKKRKEVKPPQPLELERVLGLTTFCSNMLATSSQHDLIAYAAGSVVVLYNHKKNKQVGFLYPPSNASSMVAGDGSIPTWTQHHSPMSSLINPMNGLVDGVTPTVPDNKGRSSTGYKAKPISSLAFSPDGAYLAVGETGHQPRILVWDVEEKVLVNEFQGHKFGVQALLFSPNMKYIVSLGFQHDGYLNVWNWKKGDKLACNRVTNKVNALSFSKDGTYLVTAGLRHIKFWYFDSRGRLPKRPNLSPNETQVLDGRSGILADLRDSNFVDVACDKRTDQTYYVTEKGLLCMFNENRVMDKWLNLQVKGAYSVDVTEDHVICACTDGTVRVFEPMTLKYQGTLPKPHPLGIDITTFVVGQNVHPPSDALYPDTVALKYDGDTGKLTCIYSDRSLFVWDIKDTKKIGKYRSFISHSDCVWGVEPVPRCADPPTLRSPTPTSPVFNRSANASPLPHHGLPAHTFATYSGDGTVRFWNFDAISTQPSSSTASTSGNVTPSPSSPTKSSTFRRNIYCRELVKMLYVDPECEESVQGKKELESGEPGGTASTLSSEFGIRALKMSPDMKLMATGDRRGNLRIHDMETWEQVTFQEAHDSEILTIDFTDPRKKEIPYLIATASRDRLLHVFDIRHNFQLIQTLDDHSSSITAVKFTGNGTGLISSSADKSIIFRSREQDANEVSYFVTYHNYSGRATVFDMDIDINNRYVATVGERRLNIFNIESGKPFRSYKPETAEELANGASSENAGGSLIKISLDPISGTFAATTGSDKAVRLFDLTMGTCIGKIIAHSELVTCVKFIETSDTEMRVVSTCSDGTIFIWRVSDEVRNKMIGRTNERLSRARIAATLNTPLGAKSLDPMSPLFDTPLDGLFGSDKASPLLPSSSIDPSVSNRSRRSSNASLKGLTPANTVSSNLSAERLRANSLISTGETKYEEVYKKVAARRPRAISMLPSTSTMPTSSPRSPIRLLDDRLPELTPSPSSSTPNGSKSPISPTRTKFPALPTWTKALRSKISPSTVTTGLGKSPTGPTLPPRRLSGKTPDSTATTPPSSKNATTNGTGSNGNVVHVSQAHRVDRLHNGIPTKTDKNERQNSIPPPPTPRRATSPFKPVAKMGLAGHSVKKEGSKESLRNQAHTQASHRRSKSGIVDIKGSLAAGSSSMPDLSNVPPEQVRILMPSRIVVTPSDEDDEEDEEDELRSNREGIADTLEEMDEEADNDVEADPAEMVFLDSTETEADLEMEKFGAHLLDETRRNSTERVSRNSLDSLPDGRETPVADDNSNPTVSNVEEDDESMSDDEEIYTKVLEAYLRREPPPPSVSSRNFKRQSVAVGGGIGGVSDIMAAALHPSMSMDMESDDMKKVKKRQSFSAKFLSTLDIVSLKHMEEEMPKEEARRIENGAIDKRSDASKKPIDSFEDLKAGSDTISGVDETVNESTEELETRKVLADAIARTDESTRETKENSDVNVAVAESEERLEGETAVSEVVALAGEVVKELDAEPVTDTAAMPVETKEPEVAYANDEDVIVEEEIVKPSVDTAESAKITNGLDTEAVAMPVESKELETAYNNEEGAVVQEEIVKPSIDVTESTKIIKELDVEPMTEAIAMPVESKEPEMACVNEEEAVAQEKMVEASVEFDIIAESAIAIKEFDIEPVTEAAAMPAESKVPEMACADEEEAVAHEETVTSSVEFDTITESAVVIKELDTEPATEAAVIPVDIKGPEMVCANEEELVIHEETVKPSVEFNAVPESAVVIKELDTEPATEAAALPVDTKGSEMVCANEEELVVYEETVKPSVEFDAIPESALVINELDTEPATEAAAIPVETKGPEMVYAKEEEVVAQEEIVKPSVDTTTESVKEDFDFAEKESMENPIVLDYLYNKGTLDDSAVSAEQSLEPKAVELREELTDPSATPAAVLSFDPVITSIEPETASHDQPTSRAESFSVHEHKIHYPEQRQHGMLETPLVNSRRQLRGRNSFDNGSRTLKEDDPKTERLTTNRRMSLPTIHIKAVEPLLVTNFRSGDESEVVVKAEEEYAVGNDREMAGSKSGKRVKFDNDVEQKWRAAYTTHEEKDKVTREVDNEAPPIIVLAGVGVIAGVDDADVVLEQAEVEPQHVKGVEGDEDLNTDEAGVENDLLQVLMLVERSLGRHRRSIGNYSPKEAEIAKKIETGLMRVVDEIGRGLGAVTLKTETEKKVLELVPASGAWIGDVDAVESSETTEISGETEGKRSLEMGITYGEWIGDVVNDAVDGETTEMSGLEIDLAEQAEIKRTSEPVVAHDKQVDDGVHDGAGNNLPIENGDYVKIALTEEKVGLRPNGHYHDPGDYTLLLERYSDMLVRMVTDKMKTQAETIQ